jgi:hypothetical protein
MPSKLLIAAAESAHAVAEAPRFGVIPGETTTFSHGRRYRDPSPSSDQALSVWSWVRL